MIMPPRVRKLALLLHIVFSVGWLGAVLVFLALALAAMTSQDEQTVRATYLVTDVAARSVLVPLAFASLLTGIVQSVGTPWGLFRQYWVVFKLVITMVATLILLAYLVTFRRMAAVASDAGADLDVVRNASPVLHSALALLALLLATALAVYKPRGLTRYGWRKQAEHGTGSVADERDGGGAP